MIKIISLKTIQKTEMVPREEEIHCLTKNAMGEFANNLLKFD